MSDKEFAIEFYKKCIGDPNLYKSLLALQVCDPSALFYGISQEIFNVYIETPQAVLSVEEILDRSIRIHELPSEIRNHKEFFQLLMTTLWGKMRPFDLKTPVFAIGL